MMLPLVRMNLTKGRVFVIGLSNVGAEARLQQNGVKRLTPAILRAFVFQFLSLFQILLRVSTGAAPCLGVTPVNSR